MDHNLSPSVLPPFRGGAFGNLFKRRPPRPAPVNMVNQSVWSGVLPRLRSSHSSRGSSELFFFLLLPLLLLLSMIFSPRSVQLHQLLLLAGHNKVLLLLPQVPTRRHFPLLRAVIVVISPSLAFYSVKETCAVCRLGWCAPSYR